MDNNYYRGYKDGYKKAYRRWLDEGKDEDF
jgi:hypothetical protein